MKQKIPLLFLLPLLLYSCKAAVQPEKKTEADLPAQEVYDMLVGVPSPEENLLRYVYAYLEVDPGENQIIVPQDGSVNANHSDALRFALNAVSDTFEMTSGVPFAGKTLYEYRFLADTNANPHILTIEMKCEAGLYEDPESLLEDSYRTNLSVSYESDDDHWPEPDLFVDLFEAAIEALCEQIYADYRWRLPY